MKNLKQVSIDKSKYIYNILGFLFIIIIWIVASHIYNNDLVVPKIKEVFTAWISIFSRKRIYTLIFSMISRIVLTIMISLVFSLTLATVSFISKKAHSFLAPMITIMKTVPIVAIIILLFMSIGM